MKNVATSNTSAASARHGIDLSLLDRDIDFEDSDASRGEIAEFLENDIRGYFSGRPTSLEELIFTGSFASYDGKRQEVLSLLEERESVRFLVLSYLGKMQSALKSPYRNPDLSSIAFLNRLDFFAKTAEEISGKTVSVTVAAENRAFDVSIFRTGEDSSEEMLGLTRGLLHDFGLENVKAEPLEKFLGGDAYYKEFEAELERERADMESLNSVSFRHVFDIFYTLYPTRTFSDAVAVYASDANVGAISDWATESTLRYSAFHEARAKTDFWGSNPEYIRSSVSSRPGVLVFQYGPGRVSPFNGVSVIKGDGIGTEYFSDLVGDKPAGTAKFRRLRYKNLPFCFDMR